jgi:hypothetical protein
VGGPIRNKRRINARAEIARQPDVVAGMERKEGSDATGRAAEARVAPSESTMSDTDVQTLARLFRVLSSWRIDAERGNERREGPCLERTAVENL